MSAGPLFRDTNMAVVASRENILLNTGNFLFLPAEKYCKLVRDEDGINVLKRLTRNQRTSSRAKELAQMTLDICNTQNA